MNGYLLFHTLTELFSVIIAWSILIIAWNARSYLNRGFFPWLGVCSAMVGVLDMGHTLAYKGMGIFPGDTSNLATQLWIAGRWVSGVSWVIAPCWITRQIQFHRLLVGAAVVTAGFLVVVFGGWFPDCFRPGQGLTPFKIGSEYAVCLLLAVALWLLWRNREHFEVLVLKLLLASVALSVITEITFTLYNDVYGYRNVLGHLLKIIAFAFLYQGVIVSGLRRPFETLFRDARHSEERLSAAFHGSIAGMSISRLRDGQMIDVNEAWLAMFGYERDQVIGSVLAPEVLGHPEDCEALLVDLRQSRFVENRECRYRRPTGERFIGLTSGRVTELHGESVIIGSVIDITARKKAEQALLESELKYRRLHESMRDAFVAVGIDGRVQEANAAYRELLGYSDEELRQLTNVELTPAKWHAMELRIVAEQILPTGSSVVYEKEYRRKDGIVFPVELRTFLIRDVSGQPSQMWAIVRDITERKVTEDSLRASEQRLRLATEAAGMFAWEGDIAAGTIRWSENAAAIIGCRLEELPCSLMEGLFFVVPEDGERIHRDVSQALAEHRLTYATEFRGRGEPATARQFQLHARILYAPDDGSPLRVMGVTQDITDRKRAEEALRTSLAEKEVLLREIHHRVKNNMQVLSSLVSLQTKSSLMGHSPSANDQKVRDAFDDLRDRVRSMALVHEKLYQSGNFASLDFAAYTRNLLESLWHAHRSEVAIDLKLELEPVEVAMEQAVPCGLLLNELVINALKHAFQGRSEGTVTISTRTVENGRVSLRVRDNGVGLPEGLNWREASSLGLRLVQILSRQLNGAVKARRPEGGGTEFEVTF